MYIHIKMESMYICMYRHIIMQDNAFGAECGIDSSKEPLNGHMWHGHTHFNISRHFGGTFGGERNLCNSLTAQSFTHSLIRAFVRSMWHFCRPLPLLLHICLTSLSFVATTIRDSPRMQLLHINIHTCTHAHTYMM